MKQIIHFNNLKLLTGIILMVLTSCENRDWDNPFDPGCPKEIFTPTNFAADQEGEQIKLTWNQPNLKISGFEIERKVGTGNYISISSPGKGTTTTSSNISAGGEQYTFKLVALAGENKSNEVITTITPVLKASVTTSEITNITDSTATSGGTISDDGGSTVTARGVVWNTSTNPTVENNLDKTNNGTGTGSFISELTNLDDGTTYYVRAYATNSEGVEYGNEVTFTTHEENLPSVNTFVPQNIIPGAATLGGEVTAAGASVIIERGVCWSTNPNPTVDDTRAFFYLFDSDGIEPFSREITGFLANTTYYVRAYAKNSNGTAYGHEESWTTSSEIALPTVTTNEPESITTSSAVLGGHVDNTGGTFVSEWGIVYGTSQNPTVEDNKFVIQDTEINGGSGSIGVTINELNAGTNYYVRAYAINSQGTGYGEQKTFTTAQDLNGETGTFTDSRDGNIYKWVKIGEQIWMAENLNHGMLIDASQEQTDNDLIEKYFYENNESYGDIYGAIYTWEEMMNYSNSSDLNPSNVQGVCPNGWHIPSDSEWKQLESYLGMPASDLGSGGIDRGSNEGGALKQTGTQYWNDPNTGAINSTGFTALPSGFMNINGYFDSLGQVACIGTSTSDARQRILYHSYSTIGRYGDDAFNLSVRCIKD